MGEQTFQSIGLKIVGGVAVAGIVALVLFIIWKRMIAFFKKTGQIIGKGATKGAEATKKGLTSAGKKTGKGIQKLQLKKKDPEKPVQQQLVDAEDPIIYSLPINRRNDPNQFMPTYFNDYLTMSQKKQLSSNGLNKVASYIYMQKKTSSRSQSDNFNPLVEGFIDTDIADYIPITLPKVRRIRRITLSSRQGSTSKYQIISKRKKKKG